MTLPLISVIIPNYNHERFLKRRIDSVLNQSYQNIEVIILDDCSKDNSKEIIENYRHHPKIKEIVYNEYNSGSTFRQWEKGVLLATGDYVWIAESDDWCEKNFLETLIEGIVKNDDVVLAYAQSYFINLDGKISFIKREEYLSKLYEGSEFVKKKMIKENAVQNASMAIFNRKAYHNISKEYTAFKYCGDWLFWSKIALLGNVFISGKHLNFFLNHNADVSTRFNSSGMNFIEEFNVLDILYKDGVINKDEYLEGYYLKYKGFNIQKSHFENDVVTTISEILDKNVFIPEIKRRYQKWRLNESIKLFLKKILK